MGDPFDPLGPERPTQDVPPADADRAARPTRGAHSDAPAHPSRLLSAGRLSRLDEEIEALRRSPGASQSRGRNTPPREDRTAPLDRVNSFLDGVAFMGIFSRTRDIIAANFNDMLDKADDPTKMIRMIILEMEETLVEVRASAARTIADQKEMHRKTVQLDRLQADWSEKAQLALSKDREDLARAALARQVDLEREQARQGETKAQAKREMKRLQALGEALSQRREEMAEQLRAAKIDRGSAFASDDGAGRDTIEQAVAKAEQRFARIMDDLTRDPPASSDDKAAFAEIDAIRREDAVAQRLAAIKSGAAKAKAGKKKR